MLCPGIFYSESESFDRDFIHNDGHSHVVYIPFFLEFTGVSISLPCRPALHVSPISLRTSYPTPSLPHLSLCMLLRSFALLTLFFYFSLLPVPPSSHLAYYITLALLFLSLAPLLFLQPPLQTHTRCLHYW